MGDNVTVVWSVLNADTDELLFIKDTKRIDIIQCALKKCTAVRSGVEPVGNGRTTFGFILTNISFVNAGTYYLQQGESMATAIIRVRGASTLIPVALMCT